MTGTGVSRPEPPIPAHCRASSGGRHEARRHHGPNLDTASAAERQLVEEFRRLRPEQQRILWNALRHLASGVPGGAADVVSGAVSWGRSGERWPRRRAGFGQQETFACPSPADQGNVGLSGAQAIVLEAQRLENDWNEGRLRRRRHIT